MKALALMLTTLAAVALAAPTASAGGFDACAANVNFQFCAHALGPFVDACSDAGVNQDVCLLDACDAIFQPAVCADLAGIVHAACRTGDILTDSTCRRISSAF